MTQDFADFLAALNSEGVSYVVIGGIAVMFHVPYRTTRDIDVLIEPTLDNARRAHAAVRRWGRFEPEFPPEDFFPHPPRRPRRGAATFRMGLLPPIVFDEGWKRNLSQRHRPAKATPAM